MATNASPFIVNIVPLQNLASDIRGTSDVSVLQAQVANLQTMVDTTNHILYADALSNFTPGRAIEIYSDLNLSNANLYSDSNLVILNTSTITTTTNSGTQSIPTIQYGSSTTADGGSTFITFVSTFISEPSITATFRGSVPVFISFDTVSISSFKAYSWSNNAAFSTATFQWTAIL
jgi:hypothetical protein